MKIGILGGTFDPIHYGHLILAEEVSHSLKLDKLIFVPTNIPPHKKRFGIASCLDRYNMVKLAIRGNRNFEVSKLEIERPGKSYSVETLLKFKEIFSLKTRLFFIIGADSVSDLC